MAVTKRNRFRVFKRDAFKCQYCGRTPPVVTLELDHVIPVSKGGTDDTVNLVTSCFDCNRGKSNEELRLLPQVVAVQIDNQEDRLEQLKAYYRYIKQEAKLGREAVQQVLEKWHDGMGGLARHHEQDLKRSIPGFLRRLSLQEVLEGVEITTSKSGRIGDPFKYFCGVCWKKIKDAER